MSSDKSPFEFEVRPASTGDFEAILELERSVPTAPHWSPEIYKAILETAEAEHVAVYLRYCLLVATQEGGNLLGFAVGALQRTGGAELETVAVAGHARRQGIGTALCLRVAEWARTWGASEVLLEVRASSDAAIGLYRKLGFVDAGKRPGYYREPQDDALLMRLALS